MKMQAPAFQGAKKQLQACLAQPGELMFVQLALNRTLGVTMKVDGLWGPSTQEKLVDFQKRYGLSPDGVLGRKTLAELRRQYTLGQMKSMETAP